MHNNRKCGILNSERDEASKERKVRMRTRNGENERAICPTHETYLSGKPKMVGEAASSLNTRASRVMARSERGGSVAVVRSSGDGFALRSLEEAREGVPALAV